MLYKNADYCEPDTCPSRSSRTGVVEKLKEWWRSRFGRCPGGCQKHEDEERCLAAINYCSKDTVSNSSRIYSWAYIWFPSLFYPRREIILLLLLIYVRSAGSANTSINEDASRNLECNFLTTYSVLNRKKKYTKSTSAFPSGSLRGRTSSKVSDYGPQLSLETGLM